MTRQDTRQVVITGLGPITAFGAGIQPLWDAMLAGRSAIERIRRFDPSNYACKYAAELADEDFNVRSVVPRSDRKATKIMARDTQLAVGAAAAAVEDAGLITKAVDPDAQPTISPDRVGCHIGAGLIAADVDELTAALVTSVDGDGEFDLKRWGAGGMANLTPLWLLKYLPNMLACHVTIIHDCRGPSNTITCNETSVLLSIGESMRVIERGAADACLSGGAEIKINPMGYLRQEFAGRLMDTNGVTDPAALVRPFDANASGTILGEGGGILVLEVRETASARGARVYADLLGFASTQSYCPDTVGLALGEEDTALVDVMELALEDAGVGAEAIDAMAPFGSGIPGIDQAEARAIKTVFGDRAASLPLITTVPNVGNCCAGAGAIPVCVAAMALHKGTLPARLNTTAADGIDANACDSRAADLKHVLVLSTGFGGQNAAIVLRKAE